MIRGSPCGRRGEHSRRQLCGWEEPRPDSVRSTPNYLGTLYGAEGETVGTEVRSAKRWMHGRRDWHEIPNPDWRVE
jgi:hypothetical protein